MTPVLSLQFSPETEITWIYSYITDAPYNMVLTHTIYATDTLITTAACDATDSSPNRRKDTCRQPRVAIFFQHQSKTIL